MRQSKETLFEVRRKPHVLPYEPGSQNRPFTSSGSPSFKNARIEWRANYAHYVPSNSDKEKRMEQRWAYYKNRDLANKRINEEIRRTLKQWSYKKQAIEEEIVRKQEANRYGSKFEERGVQYFERSFKGGNLSEKQILKELAEETKDG